VASVAKRSWQSGTIWALESFGPLLAFLAFEHLLGLLAAIISSIVIGALLVVRQIARDKKVSPFTAFIALSVVVFGVLDLRYQTGFFVKLEPALGNAVTALFFLGTVVIGKPVIVEFARRQRPELSERGLVYLRKLTVAWGVFFILRTGVYVWMAYHLSLDAALAIRGIAGPVSFGVMIFGEMGFRYLIYGKKAFGPGESAAPVVAEAPPEG
jgi:intracellular septation protein A